MSDSFARTSDRIYERIRNRIVTGEYQPGLRLSQRQLAKDLGVSPIPILEAIRRLETEGLLISHPGMGSAVREWTEADAEGVCVFREVLEATACRLFCIRASQSERVALTELNHKFKEAFRKKNSDAIIELDLAIHKHILTCAKASVVSLYSATATLMTTTIANSRGHSAAGRVYDSVNEHDPLVMACINPDPEEAERAGRKHVRADLQKWLEGD